MADILVVTSKVKAAVKQKDFRTSADFIEALSARVQVMIDEAVAKAKDAKRKTVMSEDL